MTSASTSHQHAQERGAAQQFQEALELAPMGGGGVEIAARMASSNGRP